MSMMDVITAFGRTISAEVTIGNYAFSTDTDDCIVSVRPHYDAELFSAVMRGLDIELVGTGLTSADVDGSFVDVTITVHAGLNSAARSYENYIVYSAEHGEAEDSIRIVCYDAMLRAMVSHAPVPEDEFPMQLLDYLDCICTEGGLYASGDTFVNSERMITSDPYDGSYTCREILSDIAKAAGGTVVVVDDMVEFKYPTESGVTITPAILKSLSIGVTYGPVNTLTLGRSPQEDNITYPYPAPSSPIEVRFDNVPIMDGQRDDFIESIYDAVSGLSFTVFDFASFGCLSLDVCDLFTLEDLDGKQFTCISLASDAKISRGIEESGSAAVPVYGATDYNYASAKDRMLNQTILRVDKQEGLIESVVSSVNQTAQSVEELETRIQQTAEDITAWAEKNGVGTALRVVPDGVNIYATTDGEAEQGEYLHLSPDEIDLVVGGTRGLVIRNDGISVPDGSVSAGKGVEIPPWRWESDGSDTLTLVRI